MGKKVHEINHDSLHTKIYADVSDAGHFVIIRQGNDMVVIVTAPGTAEAKAAAVASSLGAAV